MEYSSEAVGVGTVGTAERVSSFERSRDLEREWRALEESARPMSPFSTYDWARAWWRHLRHSSLGVRDRLDLRALRSPGGALIGVAPLIATYRPRFGAFAIRQLHYVGPDRNLTELRGALARPGCALQAHATLLDDLNASARSWDFLTLSDVPGALDLEGAIRARFGNIVAVRETPAFHLSLPARWSDFKAGLGRNIKESLRRCSNAPKRDGIDLRFEVVTERAAVALALDEFVRLHAARAESEARVRHHNVFAAPSARRFLVDVCERFAARGAFRLFRIRVHGETVAARIGFVLGDSLYLYYSGYDPAFARYSVMTTVVAEAIQHAIEQGLKTVHLSTGRDVSKLRWSPVETIHREITVVSPSVRSWVKYRASERARAWLASVDANGGAGRGTARVPGGRWLAEALGRRST